MKKETNENISQRKFWGGEFGDNFVERMTLEYISQYKKDTGTSYEEIFHEFFKDIDRKNKILELGCNIGVNLTTLTEMGFHQLYGVEINKKAYKIARKRNPQISFVHSSIEDFESTEKFDLIFTAGVLIHINPTILNFVIKKILDLSKNYIFGLEYFSEELIEIPYRGHSQKCWKQNFPSLYQKLSPSLKIIKEKKIHYLKSNLCDIAFLLKKN